MTEHYSSDDQPTRLSDEAARRLLARAIELDQTHDSERTVRDLRDAAREVGISVQAFDAALRELTTASRTDGVPQLAQPPGNIFSRLWTRVRGDARTQSNIGDAIVSNAIAAVASWVGMFLLTRIVGGFGWQGMEIGILLGCALGVGIARRLHARVVEIGFMGMAAFQAAELAMHLVFGLRSVQSGPTHFAVMIAGILGVILARTVSAMSIRGEMRLADAAPREGERVARDGYEVAVTKLRTALAQPLANSDTLKARVRAISGEGRVSTSGDWSACSTVQLQRSSP